MQMFIDLLRVIFLLSTIVFVADCCSSRILLLKEHTLKIVYQHRLQLQNQNQNHNRQQEQQQTTTPQPMLAKPPLPKDTEPLASTKNHFRNNQSAVSGNEFELEESVHIQNGTDISVELLQNSTTRTVHAQDEPNASESSNGRDQHTLGNAKFHVIDLYYTIMRDMLQIECSGLYLTEFCLNNGRCFRYPIGNHSFFSCECADGFMGERCESKTLNDLTPTTTPLGKKPKILMARFVFSFPVLITISVIYLIFGALIVFKCPQQEQLVASFFES